MDFRDWTFLVAAVGHLALGLLALSRNGRSPLALPLSLLAFDFFGWTFATFCNHQFGSPLWRCLDVVFTAMAPPVVLHVILTFVGRLRARRTLIRLTYGAFGLLATSSISAALTAWGGAWIESRAWVLFFLAGWVPTLLYEIGLLVRHLRSGSDAEEQARTRLVLAALLVGGAFASTDLWSDMGVPLPGLAPVGTLVSTLLLAVVALKFRLFDRNLGTTITLYAASVAVAAVLVYLTLFQGLRGNLPALTFAITVETLLLTAVVREASSSLSTYRERVERLAVLGRFSAQMAHDLKNPLAALVGAVQVLENDPTDGREFRAMIREQAERIRAIVEQYDRLGRVEPVRTLVRINELVKRVTALSRHAERLPMEHGAGRELSWHLDLEDPIQECELDPDLVSGALENLVRNAMEAMTRGGTLTVRTHRDGGGSRGSVLVLSVQDTGEGMDVRQAERAFDDFYTTKSTGSGLGLAFVRRVALAHGGDVSLISKRGVGTKVEIRLPID
jgi:two-component system sensor histidine kinase HydH